ncbi:MAG TPA: hypothetical protein VMN39_04680, partial [Longimicrobiaceae bacterium]|nr:hypothetical protein [Longimicrobiaceae bacterium]
ANNGRAGVIATLEDGSQVVRLSFVIDRLPPGGFIEVVLRAAGIAFLDGTTVKRFTADDLEADGTLLVDIVRPADAGTSVCHTVHILAADGTPAGF